MHFGTNYRKQPARREQGQERRKADVATERAARLAAAAEAERRQALEMEFEARQLDAAIATLSEDERQHLERAFIAGLEDRGIAGALILLEFLSQVPGCAVRSGPFSVSGS